MLSCVNCAAFSSLLSILFEAEFALLWLAWATNKISELVSFPLFLAACPDANAGPKEDPDADLEQHLQTH